MTSVGSKGVPRPEREQQIITVAIAQFAARGYAHASMVRIAHEAGISKPLVYLYFGSKDGLYLACLHDVAGTLVDRLEDAERAVDDSLASRIYPLRAMFEALEPQRDAWQLLFDPTAPASGPIPAAAASYQARTSALAAAGSGRFLRSRGNRSRLDASALTAVWTGLVTSLVSWWLEHPDESAEQMIERCDRLLRAVTDDPGTVS